MVRENYIMIEYDEAENSELLYTLKEESRYFLIESWSDTPVSSISVRLAGHGNDHITHNHSNATSK